MVEAPTSLAGEPVPQGLSSDVSAKFLRAGARPAVLPLRILG
jgi:hypothetical protein